jgi:hypothetical protein
MILFVIGRSVCACTYMGCFFIGCIYVYRAASRNRERILCDREAMSGLATQIRISVWPVSDIAESLWLIPKYTQQKLYEKLSWYFFVQCYRNCLHKFKVIMLSTSFLFKQPKCGKVGNEDRVVTWYENHMMEIGGKVVFYQCVGVFNR